ncbi:MAG TPA: serine/threonine-protein kinase [Gemmata sp.]|nr:serine/threonine-protein kinase [Gemmata sp.]
METSFSPLSCPTCGASALSDRQTVGSSSDQATVTPDELPPAPLSAPQASRRPHVPGYEILKELGRGGMGVVYLAQQISLKRVVALKMLLSGPHASEKEMARFRTEAETLASLNHSNIVHIYDVGEQDGFAYLTMEYVEAGNLAEKLAGKQQPARESAKFVQLLAGAVHAAHSRGIIHRDLKPANILLQNPESQLRSERASSANFLSAIPKITDFGLAKRSDGIGLTQTGAVLGTPSYMAPEQAQSKTNEIGVCTDVYALGAILYEMLTGRPPFGEATLLETLRKVVDAQPLPPSRFCQVPKTLEKICLRCLEKSPQNRFKSALELAENLDCFLKEESKPVPATRKRMPVVIGVLATLLILGFIIWDSTSKAPSDTGNQPSGSKDAGGVVPDKPKEDTKPSAADDKGQSGSIEKKITNKNPTPSPIENKSGLQVEILPSPGSKPPEKQP